MINVIDNGTVAYGIAFPRSPDMFRPKPWPYPVPPIPVSIPRPVSTEDDEPTPLKPAAALRLAWLRLQLAKVPAWEAEAEELENFLKEAEP
jgi:hypothetical protein